ncbi:MULTISPECIES: signal peptide peptidase SppA [Leptospira]|uniref:signal peptide peptidase SppA n=1 Tax=Leptospira TaxID=171 RepID=UPI0002BEBDC7|nr:MULTISPECIES: signal peptide peptidase SppA [Leptospira]EMJ59506.1 signal peptide peptidase SppA, 36K type [Leptospira sp. P2653]EMN45475.1 signal peptide peptidase SppA, 36K type [Leptospira weilii str. LNT 1234]MCL8265562.1 signal peptide peptidase SppA [Leptospira weilii]MDL5245337.1 signal peptide peptidase SppA [Leptospira weilii]OMI19058.1 serine protease [Leptospira weilii serovar Heyan]
MFLNFLQIVLIPFRLIFQLIRWIRFRFLSNRHYFLEIPSEFTNHRKSFLMRLLSSKEENAFFTDFLLELKLLSQVPGLKKVSVLIQQPEYGFGEVLSIAEGLRILKESGVTLEGFALTGGLKSLFLLGICNERFSSESSEFFPVLPSTESFFFGNAGKKWGVKVETFQSGPYKSFGESFQRDKFSPKARENLNSLLKQMTDDLESLFKRYTGFALKTFSEPFLSAKTLKERKFITGFLNEEDFKENFLYLNYENEKEDQKPLAKELTLSSLYRFSKLRNFKLLPKRAPIVAVLPLKGTIHHDTIGKGEGKTDGISYYAVRNALKELRDESSVKAVVLEVDSPGGSAFVSELLYQEILKLQKKKPVYAYVQNVSASGGYYLSCGASKIYASPYGIVGSIGSISLRLDLKNFYSKLGVTKDRVGFYKYRDLLSEYGPIHPESKKLMEREIQESEGLFYKRVSEARKIPISTLDKRFGQGRVFTSSQFLKEKMIDSITDFLGLLEDIKQELKTQRLEIRYLPTLFTFQNFLRSLKPGFLINRLGGNFASPFPEVLQSTSINMMDPLRRKFQCTEAEFLVQSSFWNQG